MPQANDLSRSLTPLCQDSTLIAVIEMSQSSWLVAGIVPGMERHPLKKLVADEEALLRLLQRWRDEAVKAGRNITRIVVAFEAGRDGFWLARLRGRSRQNPGNYGGLTSGFEYLDQPRAMLAQHLLWLTRHTPRQNGLTE